MALELLSALLEDRHLVQSRRHLNMVSIDIQRVGNRWMYGQGQGNGLGSVTIQDGHPWSAGPSYMGSL